MPFQKGVSGNPGGRSQAQADIEKLARKCAPEAIAALRAALDDPKTRVQAANVLLDRGFGRPAQTQIHENADGSPISIVIATAIPIEAAEHPIESVH